MKKNILIICDYYLPGFKSGGTLRTIVNMVERLHQFYDFKIITRDHDGPDDLTQYKEVKINEWNKLSNANVYYLARKSVKSKTLKKLINDVSPDCIYVNSCFSTLTIRLLMLRKLGKLSHIPLIIAPEGELDKGALSLKAAKKKNFLRISKTLGLYKDIIWKAAGEPEIADIKNINTAGDPIYLAPNMPPKEIYPQYQQNNKPKKKAGSVKLVFLSRFDRKKNFNWFIKNLYKVRDKVKIDIFAPIEDEVYWKECQLLIAELPENIKVKYQGSLPYEKVVETLFQYHFFVLPTLGENFGHVFLEALSAGCPLIASDRTPWRNLEKDNIGWNLPLEKPDLWINIITKCVEMDDAEYSQKSMAAREFAENWLSDVKQEESTKKVLESALNNLI